MKFRLIIYLFILILLPTISTMGQNCFYQGSWTDFGRYKQMAGGSEFAILHRPDIADSAYEFLYRLNDANYGCLRRVTSSFYPNTISNAYYAELALTDSCDGKFSIVDTFRLTIHRPLANQFITDSIHQNPFTSFSNNSGIHQNCSGLPADTINRLSVQFTLFPMDTMSYMREYWFSKIIYLPYPCGKWQIHQFPMGSGFPANSVTHYVQIDTSTNLRFDCAVGKFNPYIASPTDSVHALSHFPLVQFSTLKSNQMPHYLSQLDYRCPVKSWTSIPLNAVDPDGDSLVFSATQGNAVGWATSYRGQDVAQYGEILPFYAHTQYNNTTFKWDTLALQMDTLWEGYQCIPGSTNFYPNCVTYNHINNPFDCDSTYSVNPQTGEIRFLSQTPGQHVYVTVRVDEYRNNDWLSSNFRLIRIHTVDSGYVSNPKLFIDTPNVQQAVISGDREFTACTGAQIQIPFDIIEQQSVGQLTVTDNLGNTIPGANLVYTNNNSDSVHGFFTWNTLPTDSGWYSVVMHIVDSACAVSSYIQQRYEVLKIFVSPNPPTNLVLYACKDTVINGVSYTNTGIYTQVYTAINGCDSFVHINLTFNVVDTAVNYSAPNSLTANATAATYQWYDCNTQQIITGANGPTYQPTQSGSYACIVRQLECTDTSACYRIDVAPDAVQNYDIVSRLYPNPSKGTYQLELNRAYQDVQLEIRSVSGQVVWQQSYEQLQATTLKVEAPSGVYILYIKQGNHTIVQKLLKW